jgi:hypothetical protein
MKELPTRTDSADNAGFLARLAVVRNAHQSRVPHINIYDDGTYTCGICHERLIKNHKGWKHP